MTWIWILLLGGIVLNGLRLRARASALTVLPLDAPEEDVSTDHRFLVARGVQLPESTRRAASAHARRHQLQVLDLVPHDLPVTPALYLLRMLDPKAYREDWLSPGRGAGQAMLVHRDVLERAGIAAAGALGPAEMVHAATQLKSYAAAHTDVAVAPRLWAADLPDAELQEFWWKLFDKNAPGVLGVQISEYVLFVLGLVLAPFWTVLSLIAFQLQPWLIFAGGPLTPRDLSSQLVTRLVRAASDWLTGLRNARETRAATERQCEQRRQEYEEIMSGGVESMLEPRRDDCPLCGSGDLVLHMWGRDRIQHKPGRFRLERCQECQHIFQNPRVTFEGLDFYYKDFYDGEGEGQVEFTFSSGIDAYQGRASALKGHAEPKRWLDVGTGHAHFCLVAHQMWPETRFDGLDMGESVEAAQRRGWIGHAYRDAFLNVAPKIEGRYDVISMHHYLEHTPDPVKEIEAAARALPPGGHLLIELPDPECPFGRILGDRWISWFQPQHLHFLTLGNLRKVLREHGLEPVSEERGSAHIPIDLLFWWYTLINSVGPPVGAPWQPPATAWGSFRRWAAIVALAPGFLPVLIVDRTLGAIIRNRPTGSNTLRVLARKTG